MKGNHMRNKVLLKSSRFVCRRKTITASLQLVALGAIFLVQTTNAAEDFARWTGRFDMGGTIPQDANLTEFGGPTSGEKLKLSPGFQFDISGGYRLTPWLELGPELGFTFNSVDAVGHWSYPDSMLGQILMMANVRLEYPNRGRLAPFIGAGIGGVASYLSFGNHSGSYYYYSEPDGSGSDFSLGFQAFAGLRYRVADKWNLGLQYRYLFTDRQHWDVDWWYGGSFGISVDSIQIHSFCLVFSGEF